MRNHHEGTIDTTLGELIEAVSEVVSEKADNPEEAGALTAVVLDDLLNAGAKKNGLPGARSGKGRYH